MLRRRKHVLSQSTTPFAWTLHSNLLKLSNFASMSAGALWMLPSVLSMFMCKRREWILGKGCLLKVLALAWYPCASPKVRDFDEWRSQERA